MEELTWEEITKLTEQELLQHGTLIEIQFKGILDEYNRNKEGLEIERLCKCLLITDLYICATYGRNATSKEKVEEILDISNKAKQIYS